MKVEVEKVNWNIEEVVHYEICSSSTRSRQEDENEGRQIILCYGESVVDEM